MDWSKIWNTIVEYVSTYAVSIGARILASILLLFLGLKFIKLLLKLHKKSRFASKISVTARNFIEKFISIALKVVLFITIAAILGIPMTSIVTILGSAGLAIGLALQGSLSNFAGGIIILFSKPFVDGDFIIAGNYSGTVTDISILYTTLITPDNNQVTIPNNIISNEPITNITATQNRRLDLKFCVAYGTDIDFIDKLLIDTALKNGLVLKEPVPFSNLTEHNDSSLEFLLRVWCKNDDYWDVYFSLKESITKAFNENNIQIPFPQMDIHIDK